MATEEEIKKSLDWVQNSRAQSIAVVRPAEKGDLVEIDFETRHDGVKVANGDSKNQPLILGQGNFLPGFEEQILGMQAGEEKNFSLPVPENWHEKSMVGKNLDFKVGMVVVQERKLPGLTDEFAKNIGRFEGMEDLKKNIKTSLQQEKEEKEKQRVRVLAIEAIGKETKADTPEVLIESELDKMNEELKTGVEGMHMKWEDYLLQIKKTPDDLRKDWREEAEKRVRIALALRQIAKLEKIEPTEDEIKGKTLQLLARYNGAEEAEKQIDPADLRDYARGIVRNEKVFEFLEKI